jgi:predicted ATPase
MHVDEVAMKLIEVHVREFKSIWDSNSFKVDKSTCLVGKNEAGKTAVLDALYRLNPIVEADGNFDVTDDYPRAAVEDYIQDVENGRRKPAIVIKATFGLEPPELDAITEAYGRAALGRPEIVLSKGYARGKDGRCLLYIQVPVIESAVVMHLLETFELPEAVKAEAAQATTLAQLAGCLAEAAKRQEAESAKAWADAEQISDEQEKAAALELSLTLSESEPAKALRVRLSDLLQKDLGLHLWQSSLAGKLPKFLYFDEYYQMRGHENIESLKQRKANNKLVRSDYPLLGLIELARLDLDKVMAASRTQELKNKLQGASNYLSSQMLKYWSQNKHLRMNFDVRPGLPGDPAGMQQGTNIWGEVFDSKHLVSTGLGERSAGFLWFFSFLAWYSALKKQVDPLVLLLDEPGLSLHARAQQDLLRYFEAEIATNPKHQVLYTTHSPFMVDARRLKRVRIVEHRGIESEEPLPREADGTKVLSDVLEASPDSLFPLQSALGYEICQALFIGPNNLIVEGTADLLYLQVISDLLQSKARIGLDTQWTITPAGGANQAPIVGALLGTQKHLHVAALLDLQRTNPQITDNLQKKKILEKNRVLTYAEFAGKREADLEDMFEEDFYLTLVNTEFGTALTTADLRSQAPRILGRLEDYFLVNPLRNGVMFNNFRPARLLAERGASLAVPNATLDRFEALFIRLNSMLAE